MFVKKVTVFRIVNVMEKCPKFPRQNLTITKFNRVEAVKRNSNSVLTNGKLVGRLANFGYHLI